ncbi:peroxisomal biogenesis factor 2 [Niveomyces insectorum RCEF 264]|uniref:Peroxisomal biogenesis factor 2 n=1 Tax=Niveomyces insectorum RCEF 264 TaxID=1081102 RepID=A0A162J2C1_9HYPO|nr:peroxisomal biogenesis factor 2 [Niveomyces insectorum RCEF 264]
MISNSPAAQAQWPPRSPREALLGTPGGRARLRHIEAAQTSPSRLRTRQPDSTGIDNVGYESQDEEENEDEDEETLQLKLQEIQAKLRLKKLQAARASKTTAAAAAAATRTARLTPAAASRAAAAGGAALQRAASPQTTVEVPASPVRRAQAADPATQKSPKRILLGIDKGLRGQDVSLKRPPAAFRRGLTGSAGSGAGAGLGGQPADGQAQRHEPRPLSFNERLAVARSQEDARHDRSERIAKLRTAAFSVGKDEMDQYKSKAVDIPVVPERPPQFSRDDILGAAIGRKPVTNEGGAILRRSNTTPDIRSRYGEEKAAPPCAADDTEASSGPGAGAGVDATAGAGANAEAVTAGAASFEPYSGFHLSRRILPHAVVARAVAGKTMYVLKDLLRTVKAPDFELPEVETDVVVLAIVASKSDPRAHKPVLKGATDSSSRSGGAGQPSAADRDRGKYMVLTLVDLTYQVDLFLFKSGFDRYWKLTTGTVVALLNPGVMPPPPGRHDTGRWSLVINSDADTILEIGTARDLGYCQSMKRDGQLCSAWVNAKRTQYCEFHTSEGVTRMRATRNEVNGAAGFGAAGGDQGRRNKNNNSNKSNQHWRGNNASQGNPLGAASTGYDRAAQSQYYVAGQSGSISASALIDHDGMADKVERQEGIKRRLARKEKETEIARKLGEMGSGAGRAYMQLAARDRAAATASSASASSSSSATRSSQSQSQSQQTAGSVADPTAASRASLLASIAARRSGGSATATSSGAASGTNTPTSSVIQLGPAKRKRPQSVSTVASSSVAGTGTTGGRNGAIAGGLGWGSSLTAKLGRMKEGETLQPGKGGGGDGQLRITDQVPVRKKTRFLLGGKGIREAGRESLGGQAAHANLEDDDDDDDELVIV